MTGHHGYRPRWRGTTLIEVMMVTVIISVVSALALDFCRDVVRQEQERSFYYQILSMMQAARNAARTGLTCVVVDKKCTGTSCQIGYARYTCGSTPPDPDTRLISYDSSIYSVTTSGLGKLTFNAHGGTDFAAPYVFSIVGPSATQGFKVFTATGKIDTF